MAQSTSHLRTQIFPSPYGEWRVTTALPPLDLAADVDLFWESGGFVGYGFEKLVPRGLVDVIFNLAGPQAMFADENRAAAQVFKRAWISGLFDRPLFVGPAYDAGVMGTHLVSVSITPWAVRSLFGLEAYELHNAVIEASDLFGNQIDDVWHQLGEAGSPEARYEVLMAFIRRCRIRLARPGPFAAVWAATKTRNLGGQVKVQDLCNELDISRKHLGSMFKRTLGMSPKAYGRLTRFRASMAALQSGSQESFTNMALDLGFSDQAHFINEFTSYAGESPSRFLSHVSSDGESVLFEQDR